MAAPMQQQQQQQMQQQGMQQQQQPPQPPPPPSSQQQPMQQPMSSKLPPAPQLPGPGGAKPEGRPGQVWVVAHSPHFTDVIVRASQEVTSKEVRRVLPGEVCSQRDMTITLPSGLVRMPIQPDGWVTVHARHINGPTFLTEAPEPAPPQHGRPGAVLSRTLRAGEGPGAHGLEMSPAPAPPQSKDKAPLIPSLAQPSDNTRFTREDMLDFKYKLATASWNSQEAPTEMAGVKMLRVPQMKAVAPPREHRRKDRQADDDDHPTGRDKTPLRSRDAPALRSTTPAKELLQENVQDAPKPTGEEKKANCPTQ
mmetsp:Transcript_35267/g.56738  ORF Transcript_35267/g.56738 Transcript_35267/m.56738 type:complete len:309 (-) Transcript_35267:149-1075(-)